MDCNFGISAGIAEMLLQSHDTAIHVLPALPDYWKQGKVTGFRARGGFELLSFEWSESKLKKMTIKSNLGGNLRLRVYTAIKCLDGTLKPASGENPNPFYRYAPIRGPNVGSDDIPENMGEVIEYDMDTTAGQEYHFTDA
jgi:alpha-L-fucosidase 2